MAGDDRHLSTDEWVAQELKIWLPATAQWIVEQLKVDGRVPWAVKGELAFWVKQLYPNGYAGGLNWQVFGELCQHAPAEDIQALYEQVQADMEATGFQPAALQLQAPQEVTADGSSRSPEAEPRQEQGARAPSAYPAGTLE